jgi:cytochrome P450
MAKHFEAFLTTWQEMPEGGKVLDIGAEMAKLTLSVICELLFSVNIRDEEAAALDHALTTALLEFGIRLKHLFGLPMWIPTPSNRRHVHAIEHCDSFIYDFIEGHRKALNALADGESTPYNDLLTTLLEASSAEATGFSDQLLRDDIINLLVSGYETTATSLTFGFYLLDKYPEVKNKLVAELDRVLEGRSPDIADLKNLPYLESVVKEVLRLYPAGALLGRRVMHKGGFDLAGYHFEDGAEIWLAPYTIQRDPTYYEQPTEFIPERWANGELEQKLPKGSYMPFGAGPHQCLGNHFAQAEIKLILANILQHFTLELATDPSKPVEFEFFLAIKFKYGLTMRVAKRHALQLALN